MGGECWAHQLTRVRSGRTVPLLSWGNSAQDMSSSVVYPLHPFSHTRTIWKQGLWLDPAWRVHTDTAKVGHNHAALGQTLWRCSGKHLWSVSSSAASAGHPRPTAHSCLKGPGLFLEPSSAWNDTVPRKVLPYAACQSCPQCPLSTSDSPLHPAMKAGQERGGSNSICTCYSSNIHRQRCSITQLLAYRAEGVACQTSLHQPLYTHESAESRLVHNDLLGVWKQHWLPKKDRDGSRDSKRRITGVSAQLSNTELRLLDAFSYLYPTLHPRSNSTEHCFKVWTSEGIQGLQVK